MDLASLISALLEGRLTSSDEEQLFEEHRRHFRRRARALDTCFFPGGEKSPEAIESLENGAYASFRNERCWEGKTAFEYLRDGKLSPLSFLYYWRASATMRFLLREGSPILIDRYKILRNVRIHLREGFVARGMRGREPLWAPAAFVSSRERADTGCTIDVRGLRGKALITRVIESAGAPLTRSEIANILCRSLGVELPQTTSQHAIEDVPAEDESDRRAIESDVEKRTRVLYDALSPLERTLLIARGYASPEPRLRSFRTVSELLGRPKAETLRLLERSVLERFRESFSGSIEREHAARTFARLLEIGGLGEGAILLRSEELDERIESSSPDLPPHGVRFTRRAHEREEEPQAGEQRRRRRTRLRSARRGLQLVHV